MTRPFVEVELSALKEKVELVVPLPMISNFDEGLVVPIPSLLFVSSQNVPECAVHMPPLLYNICPSVPVGKSEPEISAHDNVPLVFVNTPFVDDAGST